MCWQISMSFNSFCTPSVSTPASCVCASSPASDGRDQNSRRANRDTDHHQNTRAATARLPPLHHRSRVARRRRARCEPSISNETKASTLVNQSCRTVMLLNEISHWRHGRSQTWTNTIVVLLCFQIKGESSKLSQTLLPFPLLLFEHELAQTKKNLTKTRG